MANGLISFLPSAATPGFHLLKLLTPNFSLLTLFLTLSLRKLSVTAIHMKMIHFTN